MFKNESLFSKLLILAIVLGFAYYYFTYIRKPNLLLNEIQISNLEGKSIDLNQYKGKPLIVNFWATWCGPCLRELPLFVKMKEKYKDDLTFLLISEEDPEKIIPYQKKLNFDFAISSIPFKTYGINTWPTTYFYNKEGSLINKHSGGLEEIDLQNYIQTLMPTSSDSEPLR